MRGKVARAMRHYAHTEYDLLADNVKGSVSERQVYRRMKKAYTESKRRGNDRKF